MVGLCVRLSHHSTQNCCWLAGWPLTQKHPHTTPTDNPSPPTPKPKKNTQRQGATRPGVQRAHLRHPPAAAPAAAAATGAAAWPWGAGPADAPGVSVRVLFCFGGPWVVVCFAWSIDHHLVCTCMAHKHGHRDRQTDTHTHSLCWILPFIFWVEFDYRDKLKTFAKRVRPFMQMR